MKCPLCKAKKGKRRCKLQSNEFVCSQCCGAVRKDECEGCSFQAASVAYRRRKRRLGVKRFIAEIKPDLDIQCNETLDMIESGKIDEGRHVFEELAREHGDYHGVLYGLGVCRAMSGEPLEAIPFFERAIRILPILEEAHMNLGVARLQTGDVLGAIEAFEEVIDLSGPEGELGAQAAGRIEWVSRTVRENTGLSLTAYLESQEKFDRGYAALRGGNPDEAIRLFKQVLSINPKSVQAHGNLGVAYDFLGDEEKAIEHLDKALSLNPDYEPAALNKLAMESREEGQPPPSIDGAKEVHYSRDYTMKNRSLLEHRLGEIPLRSRK